MCWSWLKWSWNRGPCEHYGTGIRIDPHLIFKFCFFVWELPLHQPLHQPRSRYFCHHIIIRCTRFQSGGRIKSPDLNLLHILVSKLRVAYTTAPHFVGPSLGFIQTKHNILVSWRPYAIWLGPQKKKEKLASTESNLFVNKWSQHQSHINTFVQQKIFHYKKTIKLNIEVNYVYIPINCWSVSEVLAQKLSSISV